MRRTMCLFIVVLLFFAAQIEIVSAAETERIFINNESIRNGEQMFADFITNPNKLTEAYAILHPDSEVVFSGTTIETMIPVSIVSTEEEGGYIDFDGCNGYMIVANGNDVIRWEANGDLEYLKGLSYTYYSLFDGFGYYENDSFVPYGNSEHKSYDYEDIIVGSPYAGQDSDGEGDIRVPGSYIADKYGSEYKLETNAFLTNFDYFVQSEFTIYNIVNDDGSHSTEGNCGLSSIFVAMNYLKESGKYPLLPASDDTVTYYAGYDSFYSKYNNDNYYIHSPKVLPRLYFNVREYAIDIYGYERDGLASGAAATIMQEIARDYGFTLDATVHLLGSFETCVKNEIAERKPVIISVQNSDTYGNHAMVVNGYMIYKSTTTILGVNFYDYVYLLRVNDNWHGAVRYFDFTEFSGTWQFCVVE